MASGVTEFYAHSTPGVQVIHTLGGAPTYFQVTPGPRLLPDDIVVMIDTRDVPANLVFSADAPEVLSSIYHAGSCRYSRTPGRVIQHASWLVTPSGIEKRRAGVFVEAIGGTLGRHLRHWTSRIEADEPVENGTREDAEWSLRAQLYELIREQPIENGAAHPAEIVLKEAAAKCGSESDALFIRLVAECTANDIAGAILLAMARIDFPKGGEARRAVLRNVQSRNGLSARQSAIEAVELWEDATILDAFRRDERDPSWLAAYMDQVIADLNG